MSIEKASGSKSSKALKRLKREGKSVLKVWRPRFAFYSAIASVLPDYSLVSVRTALYRLAGVDIERKAALLGRVSFVGEGDFPGRLHIGAGSIIGAGVVFGLDDEITIGDQVSIGPYSTLYTGSHKLGFGSRRMLPAVAAKPISVGDGSWIGIQAMILPGVTVGQGSVVSAGAVVKENVPPNSLVEGNPAIVVHQLPFGDR